MRALALPLLVSLAACSAPSTHAPATHAVPATATATPPAATAPTLEWSAAHPTTAGLPAIAADGSAVVYLHRVDGGGRGGEAFTLRLADRTGKVTDQLDIASIDDTVDGPPSDRAARAAKARAWLADRHARLRFAPLTQLALIRPDDGSAPHEATGSGLAVSWTPSTLVIRHGAEPVTSQPTPPTWLVTPKKLCDSCTETCENPARLDAAALDLARRLALVTIAYSGTDTCWEPSPDQHIVVW